MISIVKILSYFFVPQTPTVNDSTKPELFHFLKVVASEELDKLDTWDSEDSHSEGSDIDETAINISPSLYLGPKKTIRKSLKTQAKKTSKCKGITRSDKISFARWRWGKQVLAKDGSVIAQEEEELDGTPILRSTQCLEYLVIRNTGRPSTMCRKCYEINRTLQYGLRDMKRGKLGKKKVFSPEVLLPVDC
mmetsp:Transcript_35051/g.60025  ORF Transcript_35051/g.60025 Transcript_35051/m.60025 type:complete len:191 (+) Transcript_35051:139-711(+)